MQDVKHSVGKEEIDALQESMADAQTKIDNLINMRYGGLKFVGAFDSNGTQAVGHGVYVCVYYHSAHTECRGLYLLHRGNYSGTSSAEAGAIAIVPSDHVKTLKIDTSNNLVFATDSYNGSLYVYQFVSSD